MSKKVLIVEDNEQNRVLMRTILKHLRCDVIEAIDGEEGLRLAKKQKPDLIFMDVQMPVMDGLTATNILKSDPDTKDIKIVIVTSYAMKGDREKALAAGADDYIAKPINIKEIEEITGRYLSL